MGARATLAEDALALQRELGLKGDVAISLHNLARVAMQQDDDDLARARLRESLILARELAYKELVAYCLEGGAELAVGHGDWEVGARLLGAAELLFDALNARMYDEERETYEQTLEEARGGTARRASGGGARARKGRCRRGDTRDRPRPSARSALERVAGTDGPESGALRWRRGADNRTPTCVAAPLRASSTGCKPQGRRKVRSDGTPCHQRSARTTRPPQVGTGRAAGRETACRSGRSSFAGTDEFRGSSRSLVETRSDKGEDA